MLKNNLIKVVTFICLVIFFDVSIGKLLSILHANSNDETDAKLNYLYANSIDEIIILGSSRAQNHFVPSVIKNQMKQTCYNAGIGGQGLFFSYVQLNWLLKRQKPKHIILEISPNILIDKQSEEKLKILMPYCNLDTIIFNKLIKNNFSEKIKIQSHIYPYNSKISGYLHSYFKKKKDNNLGFTGLQSSFIKKQNNNSLREQNSETKLKLEYLKKIIATCNKYAIKLHLVISPIYEVDNATSQIIKKVHEYLNQFKYISLYDYSYDSRFIKKENLFSDNLHLNESGAYHFTGIFTSDLLNK